MIRRIDADEYVRWNVCPAPDKHAPKFQQAGNLTQRFDEAHHGERLRRFPGFATGSLHCRAGNAFKTDAR